MKYLLAFLISVACVSASGFTVGVTVQAVSADFTAYTQEGVALAGGGAVELSVPVVCAGSGVQSAYVSLPPSFANATNVTVLEDNSSVPVFRSANSVLWNASCNASSVLVLTVPAPSVSEVSSGGSVFSSQLLVSAQTQLRNASVAFTVLPGYTNYRLIETVGGVDIDRTQTYSFVVDGTSARFSGLVFTAATLERSLRVTATRIASEPSRSVEQPSVQLDVDFPSSLDAEIGTVVVARARIRNIAADARRVSVSSGDSEVVVNPSALSLGAGEMGSVLLSYTPVRTSERAVTFTLSSGGASSTVLVRLVPRQPVYPVDIAVNKSVNVTTNSTVVIVNGSVNTTNAVATYAVVRTEHGKTVIRTKAFDSTTFAQAIDLRALPVGQYEVCFVVEDEFGGMSERCQSVRVAQQPRIEAPSEVGVVSADAEQLLLFAGIVLTGAVVGAIYLATRD